MKKILVLFVGFVIMQTSTFAMERKSVKRYFCPQSIQLNVVSDSKSKLTSESILSLMATVRSRIGNLTRMKVFFDSSDDLDVSPKSADIDTLASGTEKNFELKVRIVKTSSDSSGSWVRLRVSYLPDYKASIAEVSVDLKSYPNETQRKQLLNALEKYQANEQIDIQAVRFFVFEN
ncbi:MAG: hypothetical protein HQM10_03165 [Candidatus Riflebacteria bacterium]|nr:hypothetical protein [Candidatus Riflebacteria bacterium]